MDDFSKLSMVLSTLWNSSKWINHFIINIWRKNFKNIFVRPITFSWPELKFHNPKTRILDWPLPDPSLNLRSLSLASKTTNQDYFGNFKRTRMSYKRWITKARGICGIKSWWNILLNSFWICKSNNMEIRYFGLEFYILTVYWGEKKIMFIGLE